MKISVIMQSFLGDYPGSRSNPVYKFHRAIESFLMQNYEDKELIIVSDDCDITLEEYSKEWSQVSSIKAINGKGIPGRWDANLRNKGLDIANGEWITYLDSDDIILPEKLNNLNKHVLKYKDADAIFNDGNELFPITDKVLNTHVINPIDVSKLNRGSIVINDKEYYYIEMDLIRNLEVNVKRHSGITKGNMFSTSRISHKKDINARWPNMSERGEDTTFAKIIMNGYKYYLVDDPTYLICHSISLFDV